MESLLQATADELDRDFGYGTARRLLAAFDRSASQRRQVYRYSKAAATVSFFQHSLKTKSLGRTEQYIRQPLQHEKESPSTKSTFLIRFSIRYSMRFFLVAALLGAVSAHALPEIGKDINVVGSSQPPSNVTGELAEESSILSAREPKRYETTGVSIIDLY